MNASTVRWSRFLLRAHPAASSVRETTILEMPFILAAMIGSYSFATGVGQYAAIPW